MSKEKRPGSKNSTKNALVHGLYAKDVLLPWDSKDDFVELHTALRAEFNPHGCSEDEAILGCFAFQYWHKRTIWRLWQVGFLSNPFTEQIRQTKT